MNYVISDIHGCYEQYKQLLKKIDFKDADTLYVLGDVLDRGESPFRVLKDMMQRHNVVFILGNHDYMFFRVMQKLLLTDIEQEFTKDDWNEYLLWLKNGGFTTEMEFKTLTTKEKNDVFEYIANASVYEKVCINDKNFILVHAGLGSIDSRKPVEECELYELLESRMDYSKRYIDDRSTYIISGHTPTPCITESKSCAVYEKNGHIALDCACVFGGRLAAYCLETGISTYVSGPPPEKKNI